MITIERFVVNMIQENCYVVFDETKEAIIIDCGALFDNDKLQIKTYIEKSGLTVKHHICTHGHFDHVMGSKFVFDTYGVRPELTAEDYSLYNSCDKQMLQFVRSVMDFQLPDIGKIIDETSEIKFGTHTFTVIPTPGHTPGGVSFYCAAENILFSGDSLFYCCIGRTDFPYGDEDLLIEKLKSNIIVLPDNVIVHPGHGRDTSIGFEKRNNPYLTSLK